MINVLGLATPLFMMLVLNSVVGRGPSTGSATVMTVLCAGMLIAYGLDFALRVARGWLSARTGARLDTLMSAEVLHHLVQLPYRHFERTPSGVIVERLRQLDVLRGFFTGQMPVLAIDLAFVALFLAATFAISATLGMVATAAIPILVGVSLATHRAQRRLTDESFQALAAKSSTLTETVANAATIKALGLEAEVEKRWQARVEQSAWTSFRANNLANIATSASGSLQLVASLVIVVIGVHEVVDHRMTVGALIAANMLATRALQPMRQLVAAWHQLQAVGAAFKRIDALMGEAVESPPGELAPMPRADRRYRLRARLLPCRRPGAGDPARHRSGGRRRRDPGHRRTLGVGQDDDRQSRPGIVQAHRRPRAGRRHRHRAHLAGAAARADRLRAAGRAALHRIGAREHRHGRGRQGSRPRRGRRQVRRRP